MNIQSISSSGTATGPPVLPQTVAVPQPPVVQIQSPPSQPSPPQAAPARAQVEQAVAKVKVQIQTISSNSLDFAIDDSSGKTIVRVTDRESGELIRQIPSQEMLEIAESLDRFQGMLVRQKA